MTSLSTLAIEIHPTGQGAQGWRGFAGIFERLRILLLGYGPMMSRRGLALEQVESGRVLSEGSFPDKSPVPEAELVRWIDAVSRDRDRRAFEHLFRYYAPRLHAYMLRAGMRPDAAEDLVQETMAEVWRKAALYRPEIAGLSTWIYSIARNLRIDRLRRVRYAEVPLEPGTYAEPGEEIDFCARLDALDLVEKMEQLPREQLSVMQMVYLEGLSHSEISERLGLPLGTVKSRLRLAFRRMREQVAGTGAVS